MSSDFDGHTPAPWHINGVYITAFDHNCDQQPIALKILSPWTDDAANANTRLIAAAPDLLAERDRLAEVNAELVEALETTLAVYVLTALYDRDRSRDVSAEEHIIAARAVLAKARGQA